MDFHWRRFIRRLHSCKATLEACSGMARTVLQIVSFLVSTLLTSSLNFFRVFFRATRRRHGIPDNDLRPFNVAYSAAMTRAREEESRAHVKSNPLLHLQGRSLDRHNTLPEQTLRNRTGAFDSSLVIFHLIPNLFPGQALDGHSEAITVPGPMAVKPASSSYS